MNTKDDFLETFEELLKKAAGRRVELIICDVNRPYGFQFSVYVRPDQIQQISVCGYGKTMSIALRSALKKLNSRTPK